ncbi:MAG: DUF1636 domain-containing protein [Rickettsiales bacterium]|jgi:predicted metal-binding protein
MKNNPVDLQVCVTCLGENKEKLGAEFYAALEKQINSAEINLQPVECFAVCKRVCTVTVSQPEKWLYMIGDLDVKKDIPALLEYVRVYDASPNGRPPISQRPEVVKNGTIARLPPK